MYDFLYLPIQLLAVPHEGTGGEDGQSLTAELVRKASRLPFAKGRTIVPVLFLKHAPQNDAGNTLLPDDVLRLLR